MSMLLTREGLDRLPTGIERPTYDSGQMQVGIVHFGVGGFFRAHQAMYLDRLMNSGTALDWAICGVGALPQDRRIVDILQAQEGLYTLVLKHPDGRTEPRVIGSVLEMLFAPDDPLAVIERMADPGVRIVSLTITEGGYLVEQVTGLFKADDPGIAADLVQGSLPRTVFGMITAALGLRRDRGITPFTVQSCDNLPGNGTITKAMLGAYAQLKDAELAHWITEHVRFPNAMVDRITPVTADADRAMVAQLGIADDWPVVCEPFEQWVIEDHFPAGRPSWEQAGAQLVDDVVPYELMKLRLLNCSHQALCYVGYLGGYRYAHEVCSDPLFVSYLLRYMEREGTPTLPPVPGIDLGHYRHQLIQRFANPAVRDTLARLCAESSNRIPKWLVPVIKHNLATGGEIETSALTVASWARYAEGTDEAGEPIDVVDRAKDRVMAEAAEQLRPDGDPLAFLRMPDFFGDLVEDDRFVGRYRHWLDALHAQGARAAVAQCMDTAAGASTS